MSFDPTYVLIGLALVAFIFFQFRTSRKRAKETAERQASIGVGVEIMTNFGVYGTVLSIDEDTNVALIETTPGTVLKIHRQTILKVADYAVVESPDDEPTEHVDRVQLNEDNASFAPERKLPSEPEFGERIDPTPTKPASKPAKKVEE